MLFNIDEDKGDRIVAWLVPDNPSLSPTLTVVVGGRTRYHVLANDFRALLKSGGLHATGICGFVIDPSVCPGLQAGGDLELFEADSNLLLFRRSLAAPQPLRLFHLETQSFPVYDLDRQLAGLIQMSYASAELIGEETLISICNIGFSESVLISGGLIYRRYAPYLRSKEFNRSILLCDPYREIAGRLVRLQMLAREGGQGWKSLGQGPLIEAFGQVDLADAGALAKALRGLGDEAFFSLADPTTRKLVATSAEEPMQDHHVGAALDSLAEFEVVGFDDDLDTFVWTIESLVGGTLSHMPAEDPPGFEDVLRAVVNCKPVRELVRLDSVVLELARAAVSRAGTTGASGSLDQNVASG